MECGNLILDSFYINKTNKFSSNQKFSVKILRNIFHWIIIFEIHQSKLVVKKYNMSTSLGKCPYTGGQLTPETTVYMICGHPHHMAVVPLVSLHKLDPKCLTKCATCGSRKTAIVPLSSVRMNTFDDTDEIEFVEKTLPGFAIPRDLIDISTSTEEELRVEQATKKLKLEMGQRAKIREEEDRKKALERAKEDEVNMDEWLRDLNRERKVHHRKRWNSASDQYVSEMLVRNRGNPEAIARAIKDVEQMRIQFEKEENLKYQKETYQERKNGKGRGTKHTCPKCGKVGAGFHRVNLVQGSDGKMTREKVCIPNQTQ